MFVMDDSYSETIRINMTLWDALSKVGGISSLLIVGISLIINNI